MKRLRRSPPVPPAGYVGDHADKLSRLDALPHDPDERPRREDLDSYRTIFDFPVPLPRFLRRRRRS